MYLYTVTMQYTYEYRTIVYIIERMQHNSFIIPKLVFMEQRLRAWQKELEKEWPFFLACKQKIRYTFNFWLFFFLLQSNLRTKKGKKPVNTSLKNQKTKQGYENTSMYYILMMYIVQVPSFLRCYSTSVFIFCWLWVVVSLFWDGLL